MAFRIRAAIVDQRSVKAERAVAAATSNSPRAIDVDVARATGEDWSPTVTLEGTLLPLHEADLGFKVGGMLTEVRVSLGARVRTGDLIAQLDSAEAMAQAAQASAQAHSASEQLALANDANRRTAPMVKSGALPESVGIQTAQQSKMAEAQLEAARAAVDLARANVASHTLRAPFDAVVSRVPTGIGTVVGPGVPLFHIVDLATLRFVGTLDEHDAQLVHANDAIDISVQGRTVRGAVSVVLASLDPATRRAPVEALIANGGDPPIFAGSFARATIQCGVRAPVVRIPGAALRAGSQDEVVVVDGALASIRHVRFSVASSGDLMVRDGVRAGESVVLSPRGDLAHGATVRVVTSPEELGRR